MALSFASVSNAKDLEGAIVAMNLTANAFQIEMADQDVEKGKEAGVGMTRYAPSGSEAELLVSVLSVQGKTECRQFAKVNVFQSVFPLFLRLIM